MFPCTRETSDESTAVGLCQSVVEELGCGSRGNLNPKLSTLNPKPSTPNARHKRLNVYFVWLQQALAELPSHFHSSFLFITLHNIRTLEYLVMHDSG